MPLYRHFSSQKEIDNQYNLSIAVPDIGDWLNTYINQSIKTRKNFNCSLNISYGASADETVDIFPAKNPNAPLVLFIHGGYWVRCSSKDFSVLVEGLVNQGVSVAVSNYSLCPQVTIDDITQQHKTLIAWLYKHATHFGVNTSNLILVGHSAGGQQVAMLAQTEWLKDYKLPNNLIKGGIPISGIFDLKPLKYSYLQPKLKLTDKTIDQQSPLKHIRASPTPLLICFGSKETNEFCRQSMDYFDAWVNCGNAALLHLEKGKHHFSIIDGLRDFNSPFCKLIVQFIEKITP